MNRERKAIEYQIKPRGLQILEEGSSGTRPEKGGIFEHVLIGWNDVEILNTTAIRRKFS